MVLYIKCYVNWLLNYRVSPFPLMTLSYLWCDNLFYSVLYIYRIVNNSYGMPVTTIKGQSIVFFFIVMFLVRASKILWKLTIYKVRWYLLSTTLQIKIYNNSYLINGLYFNFQGWFILISKYLFFHRQLKNNNFYLILLGKNMWGCGFNNSEFCFKEHCDIIWREVYTSSQLNLIMAYMVVHYQLC